LGGEFELASQVWKHHLRRKHGGLLGPSCASPYGLACGGSGIVPVIPVGDLLLTAARAVTGFGEESALAGVRHDGRMTSRSPKSFEAKRAVPPFSFAEQRRTSVLLQSSTNGLRFDVNVSIRNLGDR
jgi:hypothetical protein